MMDKNIKRTDLLNHLIRKYGLKRYIEIGLQDATQNFDKIECDFKFSVDPDPKAHATFRMTSDEFFFEIITFRSTLHLIPEAYREKSYDLIFIDGLHESYQVKKDFENALKVLSPNGFIVLHDCNPLKEEHTVVPRPNPTGHWNGDVYKFAIGIDKSFAKTVDIDNGCLVYSNKNAKESIVYKPIEVRFDFFDVNRKTLLNLISWDEFIKS